MVSTPKISDTNETCIVLKGQDLWTRYNSLFVPFLVFIGCIFWLIQGLFLGVLMTVIFTSSVTLFIIRTYAIERVCMTSDKIFVKYFLNKKLKPIEYNNVKKFFRIENVYIVEDSYVLIYKARKKEKAIQFICGQKEYADTLGPWLSSKDVHLTDRWEKHYKNRN